MAGTARSVRRGAAGDGAPAACSGGAAVSPAAFASPAGASALAAMTETSLGDVFLVQHAPPVEGSHDVDGAPRHHVDQGVRANESVALTPYSSISEVRDRDREVMPVLQHQVRLALQVRRHDHPVATGVEMKGRPPFRQQCEKGVLF